MNGVPGPVRGPVPGFARHSAPERTNDDGVVEAEEEEDVHEDA
jgi:hypothetical protein